MKKIVSVLIPVGLLAMTLAGKPAVAAAAPPKPAAATVEPQAASAVGILDLDRVTNEYKGIQQLNEDLQSFQQQQQAKLEQRIRTRLLSDAEQQEYLDLSAVGAPTEANKKRMDELATLSEKREQQLDELDKKQARTPDEQKTYEEYKKISTTRGAEMNKLRVDLETAVRGKYNELMKVIEDSVDAAVRTTAEQKKLSVVLAKQVVRYGGVDITDDVLTKLNSAPLPKPAATTPAPAASGTGATPAATPPAAPKPTPAK